MSTGSNFRPLLLVLLPLLMTVFVLDLRAQSQSPSVAEASRLRQLEERLERLEGLLSLPGETFNATELEAPESLEQRLERLETLVYARLFPSENKATPPPSITEKQPVSSDQSPSEKSPLVQHKRRYLPSLGYAGGALHYGETEQRIELHAFLDLEYIDAGPDGSRSGVSTFDNHHANVFVRSQLGPRLLGHIEIEYEHSGELVEIDQAYLEWAPTDWLSLRAGRFYTPFGIERFVWYSPTNSLVSRPAPMRQIVPGNFYANGLQVLGVVNSRKDDRLTYEIALSDGLGDDALSNRRGSRQARDNNSSRALSGRLGYALGRRAELGASYHHQRYSTVGDLDLTFVGLDFSTRWEGWELRSEWVDASIDEGVFEPGGSIIERTIDQEGFYLQLAYAFQWPREVLPELRLVSRYDVVDLDRGAKGNDDQEVWSVGFNLLLLEHLRSKFEYQFVSEDGPTRDDDAFLFQMVLDF